MAILQRTRATLHEGLQQTGGLHQVLVVEGVAEVEDELSSSVSRNQHRLRSLQPQWTAPT